MDKLNCGFVGASVLAGFVKSGVTGEGRAPLKDVVDLVAVRGVGGISGARE